MVDDLDQVLLRGLVHAAAFDARIDEGAEPDMGEQAGPAGADLAEQLHRDAAGEHVSLDLLVACELLHARRPHPVAADDALHHALVREAVHAARLAVADAERVDHGECRADGRFRGSASRSPRAGRSPRTSPPPPPISATVSPSADQRRRGFGRHELVDRHAVLIQIDIGEARGAVLQHRLAR